MASVFTRVNHEEADMSEVDAEQWDSRPARHFSTAKDGAVSAEHTNEFAAARGVGVVGDGNDADRRVEAGDRLPIKGDRHPGVDKAGDHLSASRCASERGCTTRGSVASGGHVGPFDKRWMVSLRASHASLTPWRGSTT